MARAKWSPVLASGACVDADSDLFDAVGGQKAQEALNYCSVCIVIGACDDWVKPRKSFFDGVAAGKVWRDGRPVEAGLFDEGVT